jgi:hypothetical protein
VVIAFLLGRFEVPKCDYHSLGPFITSAVRDGAGCRLTVYRLEMSTLAASQSFTCFSSLDKLSAPFAENSLSCVGIALMPPIKDLYADQFVECTNKVDAAAVRKLAREWKS